MSGRDGAGSLRQALEAAARENTCSLKDLTVLSPQRDPYRLDTLAGHRDGAWFAQMVERFVGGSRTVHLRGLHYRISAASGVQMPNGKPYINEDECWEWLGEDAAKAARWLGYVAFDRIVDEHNAPPEIFVAPALSQNPFLSYGSRIELPPILGGSASRVYLFAWLSSKTTVSDHSFWRENIPWPGVAADRVDGRRRDVAPHG